MTTRAAASGNSGGSGVAPGCRDDEVGRVGKDRLTGRGRLETHVDAESRELPLGIEDEVEQLLAGGTGGRDPQLAAGDVALLVQHDLVAGLRRDTCRLEAGRAAACDDDPLRARASRGGPQSASRPARALTAQPTSPCAARQSCTMPMHGRISAARPSRAFATHSGSAITPRPIATKSTCPDGERPLRELGEPDPARRRSPARRRPASRRPPSRA